MTKIRMAFTIDVEVAGKLQKLVAALKAKAAQAGKGASAADTLSDVAEEALRREIARRKKSGR